jgi:hypothetical protein
MRHTIAPPVIAMTLALAGCAEWLAGPQPADCLAPAEVLAAAQSGDAGAVFLAYQQAATNADRRKWICIAANLDLPEAQAEIARLHWSCPWERADVFVSDTYKAYVWSIIAMRNDPYFEGMAERLKTMLSEDEHLQATAQASAYFNVAPAAGTRRRSEWPPGEPDR